MTELGDNSGRAAGDGKSPLLVVWRWPSRHPKRLFAALVSGLSTVAVLVDLSGHRVGIYLLIATAITCAIVFGRVLVRGSGKPLTALFYVAAFAISVGYLPVQLWVLLHTSQSPDTRVTSTGTAALDVSFVTSGDMKLSCGGVSFTIALPTQQAEASTSRLANSVASAPEPAAPSYNAQVSPSVSSHQTTPSAPPLLPAGDLGTQTSQHHPVARAALDRAGIHKPGSGDSASKLAVATPSGDNAGAPNPEGTASTGNASGGAGSSPSQSGGAAATTASVSDQGPGNTAP